jgi:hypothetical protein
VPTALGILISTTQGFETASKLSDTFWTLDGNPIKGAFKFTVVGEPMEIAYNSNGHGATATLFDPESFSVVYSDIKPYKNNNLSNLTIDSYLTPTGSLVGGLPSTITLNPGDSMTLSFGTVDPSTYQLALANVAAASEPSNLFSVASALSVPEPSTLVLLVIGTLGVIGCSRRVASGVSTRQAQR